MNADTPPFACINRNMARNQTVKGRILFKQPEPTLCTYVLQFMTMLSVAIKTTLSETVNS